MVRKRSNVEVVARCVAIDDEKRLDAQHLFDRRQFDAPSAGDLDDGCLERRRSPHVAEARFHAAEGAED
jgi:hypothetical protein